MRKWWIVVAGFGGFATGVILSIAAALLIMSLSLPEDPQQCESPCDGPAMAAVALFSIAWPVLGTIFATVFALIAWWFRKRRLASAP